MVYFVGAGPGDPELLTIKGKKIIDGADLVIYTGSLVNPEILAGCKKEAKCLDSASMTLQQVTEEMLEGEKKGWVVARVHTGDPSIYGTIREQMRILDRCQVPYQVIPGVSSFLAGAAALKREFTLPEVSQTLILTRIEGRTPVPRKESLEGLAQSKASMVIFLSVGSIQEVVQRLLTSYPPATPAAVVYKASWKEERIVQGTLEDIAQKTKEAGIQKTALIYVGDFLGEDFADSRLYHPSFSHGFRGES